MRREAKGGLLVAVSAVSFGLMPIFAKLAYGAGASTYTVLFLRFLVGAAVMFLLMGAKRMKLPARRDIVACLLLGAVGYVGQSFCYFTALNYASSGVVSLLLYTYPALVMGGSALFFGERITARKALALVLALGGAAVIIGSQWQANPLGLVLGALAAVFYTAYILISSRFVKGESGVQSSAFIMLGAAVVYGAANLILGFEPPAGAEGWTAVLLIALVSTALAFWSFFAGMEQTGPTAASLISTLEPVVTVVFSALILREAIGLNTVVGGALVLGAVIVTALPEGRVGRDGGGRSS